ncbi:penicillin-binding protein activator [Legionella saoudiensis]|uniref:penicillin-binding protein activator n=1 Tax=Legionella saoudiensis TaxID=1750561 RepID=UPI0007312B27|nr:penicillin-binding protein activator [Legionella saoudiensis]
MLKIYKIRVLIFLTSTVFLCQCTTAVTPSVPELPTPAPAPVAVKKKPENPYPQSTSGYLTQAQNQQGYEKQKSLLMAAGRSISEGQWQQGAAILTQTADLTPELMAQKNILLAQIDVMRDRPQKALSKLASIEQKDGLPRYQQAQYHELLAQAYRAIDKPMESITERVRLDPLLMDEDKQKLNRRKLWVTITHLSQAELDNAAATAVQPEMQGWLQLALIARKYRDNSKLLLAALDHWQTQFNNHPANNLLPNPLDSITNKMLAQPKQVALLLPLSGALQGPGSAIRDGFMAAKKNNPTAVEITVKTYDTSRGDVASLYQSAIADGANYIVGPLTKAQVAAVAALPHPVPTLLLNDAATSAQENSYSLSLSPVYEAQQVAIRARSKGYHRALIIAPGNEWGNEVIHAFTKQWQKKGGQVSGTLLYGAKDDLNKKMRDFLHITNSQQREKQIKELLGYSIQSMISRRQDFDMIFLLAYPSKARQIMPLLNYYYAADVPVYATASVYGGNANPLKDKDLDGIIFCDIPWVFGHQMRARNWPEQFNSYNRLYALGKDSYALATQLNHLMLFPADASLSGDGILYLKPSQQVARVLEWGQFKQGLVHSLGETA